MKTYKMETKNEIKLQMRISSINVLKFCQYDVNNFLTENGNLEFQSNFEFKILEESNEIGILSTIILNVVNLNTHFGELKVQINFNLHPFNDVIKKIDEKSFNIPDVLMSTLTNIATGTVRGILYEKFKGTIIQNEIFPLLDINNLLKSNQQK